MTYTIEQQGARWIASDGIHNVEGEDAEDALYHLVMGTTMTGGDDSDDVSEAVDGLHLEDAKDGVCHSATRLIRLVTMNAPPDVLAGELDLLSWRVRGIIEREEK